MPEKPGGGKAASGHYTVTTIFPRDAHFRGRRGKFNHSPRHISKARIVRECAIDAQDA